MSQTNGRKPHRFINSKNSHPTKAFLDHDRSSNGELLNPGSLLKDIRLLKGLSLRALAEKLGLEKTRMLRLERKSLQDVTVGELELFANGIGIQMEELISNFKGPNQGTFYRSSLKNPAFTFEPAEGIRFGSFLKDPEPCFIGTLRLEPYKSLSFSETPKGELLFFSIREGTLYMKLSKKEYVFKEGEYFYLRGTPPYELYNPHQFKPLIALLVATPSFIRKTSST